MVWPSIQWFGKGFGQKASTSKRGATTDAAGTTGRFEIATRLTPDKTLNAHVKAALPDKVSFISFYASSPPHSVSEVRSRFLQFLPDCFFVQFGKVGVLNQLVHILIDPCKVVLPIAVKRLKLRRIEGNL